MGLNKPNKIITHHFGGTNENPLADTSKFTAQDVDNWHKARWPGFTSLMYSNNKGNLYHVGYHFIIEKSGKVVQCRAMWEEAAAVIGQNKSAVMVCFAGNFDLTKPNSKQMGAWKKLYLKINKKYPSITTSDVFPHRMYAVKSCHGNNLTDDFFISALKNVGVDEAALIRQLQQQLVQLLTQLVFLLKKKRYSTREI